MNKNDYRPSWQKDNVNINHMMKDDNIIEDIVGIFTISIILGVITFLILHII